MKKLFFLWFFVSSVVFAEELPTVRVIEAKQSEVFTSSYYGGRIEPYNTIKHYSTINGFVTNLKVKEGDRVQKGEVICLIRRKIGSESYQPAIVNAVISGIVVNLKIIENMEVFDKSELFSIADDSKYKLTILVSDREILNLKTNEECYIREEILQSNKIIKGYVSNIGRIPLDNRGLFQVEITVNKSPDIFIGKFMVVELRLNKHFALTVPQDSVVKKYGKDFIFVIEGENIAKLREVKIGQSFGDLLEILDGLKEKERFIVVPPPGLRDGDKVNIRTRGQREKR